MSRNPTPDDLFIETKTIPSHFTSPCLVATFEQSRSGKGVAVGRIGLPPAFVEDNFRTTEAYVLREVLSNLREATTEAHGVDVMPHQDDWYWLDPWPPKVDSKMHWIYRTILKYGDGVTNLREHAAFTLRMAEARGVKIRVPIKDIQQRVVVPPSMTVTAADLRLDQR